MTFWWIIWKILFLFKKNITKTSTLQRLCHAERKAPETQNDKGQGLIQKSYLQVKIPWNVIVNKLREPGRLLTNNSDSSHELKNAFFASLGFGNVPLLLPDVQRLQRGVKYRGAVKNNLPQAAPFVCSWGWILCQSSDSLTNLPGFKYTECFVSLL